MYELGLIAIGAMIGLLIAAVYAVFSKASPASGMETKDTPDRRALFAALRRHNAKPQD